MKRKKKMWMFLAAALLCLGMSSSVWAVTETLETDVTEAGDGCELFGVRGSYLAEESERIDTLTELNRIRKEACVNGVELNGEKLTASDYVELKWSRDLENIARIRAAEAYVQTAFWDTDIRLNGKKFSTLTMNGVTSDEELRLWTWAESIYAGVYNWYTLKSDEYYTLIDPQYHYVGMGLFHRDNGTYSGTITVEFSTSESLKEGTPGLSVEDCIQNVEVKTDYLSGEYAIEGTSTGKVGDVCALDFTTSISSVSMQIPLIVYQPTSWLSSDTSVASMSGAGYTGYLSVKGCGTATIKAIAGENTAKLTFNASHSETQKVTPATTAHEMEASRPSAAPAAQ